MVQQVDLAIVFRSRGKVPVKSAVRADAKEAEEEYNRLLNTLKGAGLQAVGRRGAKDEELVVLVYCPEEKLAGIVQRERYSDFLCGLSTTNLASVADGQAHQKLAPADRLRLLHEYITSTTHDNGLGIIPGLPKSKWGRVESVMCLHDHDFNTEWIKSWSTHRVDQAKIDQIRSHYGEGVALYFAFLLGYTHFLVIPSALGVIFYFLGTPYSSVYSTLLVVWSVFFVEWWRIRERVLSVRWSTRGSFRVERRRPQYVEEEASWYVRDARTVVSLPVILMCAGVLGSLLTGIFVFEAFVTQLYTGPGHQFISLAPTVVFMAVVPRFLALYQAAALRLTRWENHKHQSTHEASITIKTFSLSAIVAYLGLALSAFVYVPFGGSVMNFVHTSLFKHGEHPAVGSMHAAAETYAAAANATGFEAKSVLNGTAHMHSRGGLWEPSAASAQTKLNPTRLQSQMFAYTVTNQLVNAFLEVGLPFVLRAVSSVRAGKGVKSGALDSGKLDDKHAARENETAEIKEERELLERVRAEVALPEYTLFADYSEMVTQFGYVALWSTIWPLAPAMSFLNNLLELRADAYKITVHQRRPVPARTDTIGPWLESLSFLTWLGALTNAALVYLFHPQPDAPPLSTELKSEHPHTAEVLGTPAGAGPHTARQLLLTAATIALLSSHGLMLLRVVVRHALERAMWKQNKHVQAADEADRTVKERYMRSLGVTPEASAHTAGATAITTMGPFWENDEGLAEIRKSIKDE